MPDSASSSTIVLVGLLVEGVDHLHGIVAALGVDVAQARVVAGRLGTEHDHRLGGAWRAASSMSREAALKASSSVMRWSEGAISAGALPYRCDQRRDAQRERRRGAGRVLLEDQVLRRHRAEGRARGVREAGTRRDVDAAGVDDLAEPLDRAGEQRPVAHDGLELLGSTVAADRPQARALSTGEDDGDGLVGGLVLGHQRPLPSLFTQLDVLR